MIKFWLKKWLEKGEQKKNWNLIEKLLEIKILDLPLTLNYVKGH